MASVTASTTPTTPPASDPAPLNAAAEEAPAGEETVVREVPHTGSLSRRMMIIAAGWITFLLLVGGVALDRTLAGQVTRNFDDQLNYMLTAMIGSVEATMAVSM